VLNVPVNLDFYQEELDRIFQLNVAMNDILINDKPTVDDIAKLAVASNEQVYKLRSMLFNEYRRLMREVETK